MKSNIRPAILKLGLSIGLAAGLYACSQPQQLDQIEIRKKSVVASNADYDYQSDWLHITLKGNADKNAPHLILIPGLVSSPEVWSDTLFELGKTHRLHLVGISGFAGLEATDKLESGVIGGLVDNLATYIKTQSLENVTILGHSMGGFTGLNMAITHGDLLDKVIIVDSLPFYSALFNPAATAQSSRPHAAAMRSQILAMDEENFKQMQIGNIAILSKNELVRKDILAWSLASDRETMAKAMHELMVQDKRKDLAAITTQTHVIYAWDEAMRVPAEHIETLYKTQYKNLKATGFTKVEGSFHFIMKDKPQKFIEAVQIALADK